MAEIEVKGTFNAQAFSPAVAAFLTNRAGEKKTETATANARPAEPVRAAG